MGTDGGDFEWIALEVNLYNRSDRPVMITSYGLTLVFSRDEFVTSTVVEFGELENGDTYFEDPETDERVARNATLSMLPTPVNVAGRQAVADWIAFRLHQPVSGAKMDTGTFVLLVGEAEGKEWRQLVTLGPLRSRPNDPGPSLDLRVVRR